MPTYAQRADFEAYVDGWVTDDPAALDRLLERAERDIDLLMGNRPVLDTGLKLALADLAPWEADALARAVCAQAEYRFTVGEAALRGGSATPVIKSVKGPDFEKTYAVADQPAGQRKYGPKVRDELATIHHLRALTGRAMP